MRLNTILLIILLLLLLIFAVINRGALLAAQPINVFGAATYTGPLGLLLLATIAIVALLFYALASYGDLRSRASEARTLREMHALRQSLDQNESSRFAQLQAYLDQRLTALETSPDLAARFAERVRDDLSADIGQLYEYLHRRLGDVPGGELPAAGPPGHDQPDRNAR